MGGITTLHINKLTDDENPPRTLSSNAILNFASHGLFFDVSLIEILDKSKTNEVAKGLICFQVIWFGIQIFARRAAKLPLTLIEIHTTVHVVCALVMYVLWWKVSFAKSDNFSYKAANSFMSEAATYFTACDSKYF